MEKLLLLLILGCIFCNQAFANVMTIEDVLNIKTIDNVQISPDGQKVAYTVKSNDLKANKSITQIWLTTLGTGTSKLLGDGQYPQWSHTGSKLAWLLLAEGKNRIKIIDDSTGTDVFLTGPSYNISAFSWSPDDKTFAFLAPYPLPTATTADTKYSFVADTKDTFTHIWLCDTGTNNPQKLTSGNFSVTSFDWAPEGKRIAFIANTALNADSQFYAYLRMTSVPSGNARDIIPVPVNVGAPMWSPDGKKLAYIYRAGNKDSLGTLQLRIYYINEKKHKIITEKLDEDIDQIYDWSQDSNLIYFKAAQGVSYHLFAVDINTYNITPLTTGNDLWEHFSFNRTQDIISFTIENADTPPELYLAGFPQISPHKITTFNADLLNISMGQTQIIRWKSYDGTVLEGLLTKPVDYVENNKYPLLTIIHGGPASCWSNRYCNSRYAYPTQVFAGMGYAVFLPNVRGSTGYGEKFRRKNFSGWGEGDYRDLMSGIDNLITTSLADQEKLGIMGWSYGGYLTARTIGKTNRFKAASVGAGISNLYSYYGTVDIPSWLSSYYKEKPYMYAGLFLEHSPVSDVNKIKTPVLIQHGQNDTRVPFGQAQELYRALQAYNVPAKLIIYPGQGHMFSGPLQKTDCIKYNLDWFEKYLK